jgi:hypothetical protein
MWALGRPNGREKMKTIIFSRFERRASSVLSRQSEKSIARIQPIGRILHRNFCGSLRNNYTVKTKKILNFHFASIFTRRDKERCEDPEGMLIYCCAMRSSTSSAIRTGKFARGEANK